MIHGAAFESEHTAIAYSVATMPIHYHMEPIVDIVDGGEIHHYYKERRSVKCGFVIYHFSGNRVCPEYYKHKSSVT